MSKKLLITDITNLTDARYFAALDVAYLGFSVEQSNPLFIGETAISEIMNWTEGPALAVETGLESEKDLDALSSIEPELVIVPPFASLEPNNIFATAKIHVVENEIVIDTEYTHHIIDFYSNSIKIDDTWKEQLTSLSQKYSLYIKPLPQVEEVKSILKIEDVEGIVLMGSEEEEVGLKSFEEVDDIMDLLIEEI